MRGFIFVAMAMACGGTVEGQQSSHAPIGPYDLSGVWSARLDDGASAAWRGTVTLAPVPSGFAGTVAMCNTPSGSPCVVGQIDAVNNDAQHTFIAVKAASLNLSGQVESSANYTDPARPTESFDLVLDGTLGQTRFVAVRSDDQVLSAADKPCQCP